MKGEDSNLKAAGILSHNDLFVQYYLASIQPLAATPVFTNNFLQILLFIPFISFSFKLLLIVFTKLYIPQKPVKTLKIVGGIPNIRPTMSKPHVNIYKNKLKFPI